MRRSFPEGLRALKHRSGFRARRFLFTGEPVRALEEACPATAARSCRSRSGRRRPYEGNGPCTNAADNVVPGQTDHFMSILSPPKTSRDIDQIAEARISCFRFTVGLRNSPVAEASDFSVIMGNGALSIAALVTDGRRFCRSSSSATPSPACLRLPAWHRRPCVRQFLQYATLDTSSRLRSAAAVPPRWRKIASGANFSKRNGTPDTRGTRTTRIRPPTIPSSDGRSAARGGTSLFTRCHALIL